MASLLVGLAIFGFVLEPGPETSSAESLTLRDGKIVLGQFLESDRRGPLLMLVRRDWAAKNLPDRLALWEKLEAPSTQRAEKLRRERLEAWKRDRRAHPAEGDRISAWIDGELARLANRAPDQKSTLMVVKIGRAEVKAMERKSNKDKRLLRIGWLAGFPDVERMSVADLTEAADGRGFSATSETPISVDGLLPVPLEDDAHWLVRRAATEVANDSGSRLVRYRGMVMAEPAPGEAPPAGAALNAALGSLKELLGEQQPVDPLPAKLRELAGQGRVGVVVTRLELAPDMSSTSVETTLWVRFGERWNPAMTRTSSVRPDDIPANAGADLADDPQVKAAFGVVESLGIGQIPPELKQRTLNMGAATRKALGQARNSLDAELKAMALSLEPVGAGPGAVKP